MLSSHNYFEKKKTLKLKWWYNNIKILWFSVDKGRNKRSETCRNISNNNSSNNYSNSKVTVKIIMIGTTIQVLAIH